MASAPAATVLVAVFNGADYLPEAITSIFAQTFSDFELLVVDDGSTDQTQDILRSFPDPRMRAIVLSQNRGIARARNAGLEAAGGVTSPSSITTTWHHRSGWKADRLSRSPSSGRNARL